MALKIIISTTTLLLSSLAAATPVPSSLEERQFTYDSYPIPQNNFTCKPSPTHPNPVVLFHGLGATSYEDLNFLQQNLTDAGFCTFSITYGAYPGFPYVGGLQHISDSAAQLATFVKQVHSAYPTSQVDFVGHSEGAFQTLYFPKFEAGIKEIVGNIIAIAPPTHGTNFANLYTLSYIGGNLTNSLVNTILDDFGCDACSDLVTNGPAVKALTDGPIAQTGPNYTILISRYDELVTPPTTAFVNETGVRNLYVQDFCPMDPVGHLGEAYDYNVWAVVRNSLSGSAAGPAECTYGSPGK
ncbi:alpha beta fold hydrolase [Lecanosticta acicola]|uniref:Alpha beta fold hydrolase n=1 Tax=Lecanosticta acicola TaxID=111012 RepID=A0AAI9EDE4_9PEZI|nr:alpha beta fold hydrolase [Lecanosticta acicola]